MKKYERLTTKGKEGNWQVWEDDYSHPFEALQCAIDRLAELEDDLESGKLIRLPCKVGDTVWYIKSYGFGLYTIKDMTVAGFNFSRYEDTIWVVGNFEEQASKIFKTKAEAEAKLKELQNEYKPKM